ncbi:TauD/TfdA dioxygenase family protein [Nocardia vaccinii]|uniref:TauD/TfdA dioxygenase family protein n=1 Tax=Nocardia vaccinii TaxID=1822 RepID=UPI00083235E0|nr:TauD/TfdA family dioxygenase [Nocardia vaccinii]
MTEAPAVAEPEPTVRPFPLPGYPLLVGPFTHLTAEHRRLSALRWQHFDAQLVGTTLGGRISGIDLREPLAEEVVAELRQALHEYKVLFFRDQPITPAQHVAFARGFGELEVHPALGSNSDQPELVRFAKGADVAGLENTWHHDVTWRPRPSMGAILHAISVPEVGGDTLFSDMYAAYAALDEDTRALADELTAVHDFTRAFGRAAAPGERERMRAEHPSVEHPVVCTHAATGRRHLYVNRIFVDHIAGRTPEASRELLDRLCRQADYPEHQVRLHWEPHTVAFWDNRAVQHYATSDYWPQVRVMERASIVGPRPSR